ncbi:MAG: DNA-3-methyladenine glycosylase [Acidobacteriia bacterium]|nr:DNA-3-methyladenine glycosylase [Terriglobia bacterium]
MRKDPKQIPSRITLPIKRLRRSELPVDTLALAKYLIGKTLVRELPRGRLVGRIVETEAYPVGDAAGHAFGGKTPSRHSLFLPHGHAYVYFTYGSCFMMNVSSETVGVGAGVLIRALEPLEGITFMERRRRTHRLLDLTRGPGRLAQAFDIDKRLDGLNLCSGRKIWLGDSVRSTGPVGKSIRIGINREVDRLYRFYERGNPFVSGLKRMRE